MRPKLLDLFCGAGGCSVGYERAGFEVTGVDKDPHPDYPFELIQADFLDLTVADHAQDDEHYRRPDGTRRGNKAKSLEEAQWALGIDWMTDWDDLTDAIPPAYTEHIGHQLIEHLAEVAA